MSDGDYTREGAKRNVNEFLATTLNVSSLSKRDLEGAIELFMNAKYNKKKRRSNADYCKAYNIHKRKQKHTKLETQQQIQTKHQISRHEFDEENDDEEDF